MGLFLSMSGVVGGDKQSVVKALRAYAESKQGSIVEEAHPGADDDCLVLAVGTGGVTVVYPGNFLEWDDASQELSRQTGNPVFSFHIHDGDLWMYLLFKDGEVVDCFNPIPDYWQEVDDRERHAWRGDSAVLAEHVPGLQPEQIVNYLMNWNDDLLMSDVRRKAYPNDEFFYGDDWQLVDFMSRVGLVYPSDDDGGTHGDTYQFVIESD
jgi:hypothetical protein